MKQRRIKLALLIFAILTGTAVQAAEREDRDSVADARARLLHRLADADAAGFVSVREDVEAFNVVPPRDIALPVASPRLRSSADSECMALTSLSSAMSFLKSDNAEALDQLRKAVLAVDNDRKPAAELSLAGAYLALGFAEEARAIAISRTGAEAAAIASLALLMEGKPERARALVSDFRHCGALFEFVDEAAGVLALGDHHLSDKAQDFLGQLPAPVQQPIAEAFAVLSISAADGSANAYVGVARKARGNARTEAGDFIDAVASTDEKSTLARLAALSGAPGPLRPFALHELSKRLEGKDAGIAIESFENNAADVLDSGDASSPLGSISLALSDRRAVHGDQLGAAKALRAAYNHAATRNAALIRFGQLARPLLSSERANDRLIALGLIAAEPEMANNSLTPLEIKEAAAKIAELGAAESLTEIVTHAKLTPIEGALLLSEVNLRAGRFKEARAFAEPFAKESEGVAALLKIAQAINDPESERILVTRAGVTAYADFLWRTQDFRALESLASGAALGPESIQKVALAFLASGHALPANVSASAPGRDGFVDLFAVMPDTGEARADELLRFSGQVARAIKYLRSELQNE